MQAAVHEKHQKYFDEERARRSRRELNLSSRSSNHTHTAGRGCERAAVRKRFRSVQTPH